MPQLLRLQNLQAVGHSAHEPHTLYCWLDECRREDVVTVMKVGMRSWQAP